MYKTRLKLALSIVKRLVPNAYEQNILAGINPYYMSRTDRQIIDSIIRENYSYVDRIHDYRQNGKGY